MKRIIFSIALCAVVSVGVAQPVLAQFALYTTPPAPWVNRGGPPKFVSPEVLPDRRIVFRTDAPKGVTEVEVVVGTEYADQHTYPMTRGADGIWSATVGPVDPEVYPYYLRIGGVKLPENTVEVRGDTPGVYDVQDVPHGSTTSHIYFSKAQNRQRDLTVYVPPQYYTEPKRRFPVVYNFSGGDGGRSVAWNSTILDNLIAQHKAVPMLMVMMSTTVPAKLDNDAQASRVMNSDEVRNDIIPFVEKYYRTAPGRDNRAIVGISHSGGSAFTVGTSNLDKFGNMGLIATGMFGGLLPSPTYALYEPYEPEKLLPPITKEMREPGKGLKLFYMSVGNIDPRMPFVKQGAADFEKYGIKSTVDVFPGGHQDHAHRAGFVHFLELLFH